MEKYNEKKPNFRCLDSRLKTRIVDEIAKDFGCEIELDYGYVDEDGSQYTIGIIINDDRGEMVIYSQETAGELYDEVNYLYNRKDRTLTIQNDIYDPKGKDSPDLDESVQINRLENRINDFIRDFIAGNIEKTKYTSEDWGEYRCVQNGRSLENKSAE